MFTRCKNPEDFQAFLNRQQDIDNPVLRSRVIEAVDRIATDAPSEDLGNGFRHTVVRWAGRDGNDVLVSKMACPDGTDYQASIDTDVPFEGVDLFVTSRSHGAGVVRWTPALGFDAVDEFVDWLVITAP